MMFVDSAEMMKNTTVSPDCVNLTVAPMKFTPRQVLAVSVEKDFT
jgi:hypothetical protein